METVGQGCCRRLMAAESVLSRQQSAPCIPAHFASGLSSLAGSLVLYENGNEFTEKSGAPPFLFHPNPALTLCSCVGTLLTRLSVKVFFFFFFKQSQSAPILSPFNIFPFLRVLSSLFPLSCYIPVRTVQSGLSQGIQ